MRIEEKPQTEDSEQVRHVDSLQYRICFYILQWFNVFLGKVPIPIHAFFAYLKPILMKILQFFPFPHIYVWSGYILTHSGRLLRTARNAVKTKPRYAGLVPKGSLSLTRML